MTIPTPASTNASWDSYNELLIHGGLDRFTKLLSRYELYKRIIHLPGDIVEGGVFKGAGLFYWAKLVQIFNPMSRRKVIGFDTFDGFPAESEVDKQFASSLISESNYHAVSTDYLYGIAEEQRLEHRIELVGGDCAHSITNYTSANPGFRIALLNLDFAAYRATLTALEALYDLVVPGGVIVFDEYALPTCTESQAVDEFFRGKGCVFEAIPWNLSPSAFVVKGAT